MSHFSNYYEHFSSQPSNSQNTPRPYLPSVTSGPPPPIPPHLQQLHEDINVKPGDMEKEVSWAKTVSATDSEQKAKLENWHELARLQEELTKQQNSMESDSWKEVDYRKKQGKHSAPSLSHGPMNDTIPPHHFFKNSTLANSVLAQIYNKSEWQECSGLVVRNLTGRVGDKGRRYRQLVIKEDETREKKLPHITFHAPTSKGDYREGVVHIKNKKNEQILLTFVRESTRLDSKKIWKVHIDGKIHSEFREIIDILNCLLADPNITLTLNKIARWLYNHRIFNQGGIIKKNTKKNTKKNIKKRKKREPKWRRKVKTIRRKLRNEGKYLTRKLHKYL